MAKEVFGEFSAYTTPGGIRFMKAGRLQSEASIPPEVVAYLKSKLGDDTPKVVEQPAPEAPRFPKPTPEQLEAMRLQSLQVPPELQMSPDEIAARSIPTEENPNEVPLTPDDFDMNDEEQVETRTELTPTQTGDAAALAQTLQRELPSAPLPENNSDFLESVSIHTADLEDIAHALYERFGIYTVYLRELPRPDEVNPLTGVAFTKYHLGIAYQAAIFAQNHGYLDKDAAAMRRQMDADRAASAGVQESFQPIAHTLGESRRANDFNYRTSVKGTSTIATTRIEHVMGDDGELHAVQVPIVQEGRETQSSGAGQRYDAEEDEQIVEPPIFGAKPIIRPNW